MRIDMTATYGPLSAVATRNLLSKFTVSGFTLSGLAGKAGTSTPEAADLASALVAADLIEEGEAWSCFVGDDDGHDAVTYILTSTGLAFAQAKLGTVKRSTAERALAQLLERAAANNADPDATHQVTELVVFGSYLDKSVDQLGDLDIAISLADLRPAGHPGRLDWMHGVGSREKTLRSLKARSRTLSFVDLDEHRNWLADKPHQVAFAADRGAVALELN